MFTPEFGSPEFVRGFASPHQSSMEQVDTMALDAWSLGTLLVLLLSGTYAFSVTEKTGSDDKVSQDVAQQHQHWVSSAQLFLHHALHLSS